MTNQPEAGLAAPTKEPKGLKAAWRSLLAIMATVKAFFADAWNQARQQTKAMRGDTRAEAGLMEPLMLAIFILVLMGIIWAYVAAEVADTNVPTAQKGLVTLVGIMFTLGSIWLLWAKFQGQINAASRGGGGGGGGGRRRSFRRRY